MTPLDSWRLFYCWLPLQSFSCKNRKVRPPPIWSRGGQYRRPSRKDSLGFSSVRATLDEGRDALAARDAEHGDTDGLVLFLQLVHKLDEQNGTGGTERVTT